MTDAMKLLVRTTVIAAAFAALIAVFALVEVPVVDWSPISYGLGKALAIAYHWCPPLTIIFPFSLNAFRLYLALLIVRTALISSRMLIKINEG